MTPPPSDVDSTLLTEDEAKALGVELGRLGSKKEEEAKEKYSNFLKGLVKFNLAWGHNYFKEIYHYNERPEEYLSEVSLSNRVDDIDSYPFDVIAIDKDDKVYIFKMVFGEKTHAVDYENQIVPFLRLKIAGKKVERYFLISNLREPPTSDISKVQKKEVKAGNLGLIWLKDISRQVVRKLENSISFDEIEITQDTLELRPWQVDAIADVTDGLYAQQSEADHYKARGQLIMPCGTGKTIASLRIAEDARLVPRNGRVLFLVPSIALMDQAIREWIRHRHPARETAYFAVCSDETTGKSKKNKGDTSGVDTSGLMTTPTTDLEEIIGELKQERTIPHVTFCTYQSLERIVEAQKSGVPAFDLVIADEAHRTTGVIYSGETAGDSLAFTRVHHTNELRAKRRLYMTATPKIYTEKKPTKQERESLNEDNKKIAPKRFSMDNDAESDFGPVLYRLSFREAVRRGALVNYEVVIVWHDKDKYSDIISKVWGNKKQGAKEVEYEKLAALWDALANPIASKSQDALEGDIGVRTDNTLKTVITYTSEIPGSKKVAKRLGELSEYYANNTANEFLQIKADHVDGTMSASERFEKIDRLRKALDDSSITQILSNVRCLTEGVDVQSLDAIAFLNYLEAEINIIQAVGRVMRTAKDRGKEKGFIIIPVLVDNFSEHNSLEAIREEISSGEDFKLVWNVLRALRAHDNDDEGNDGGFTAKVTAGKISDIDEVTFLNRSSNPAITSDILNIFDEVAKEKLGNTQYWYDYSIKIKAQIEEIEVQINRGIKDYPEVEKQHEEFLAAMNSTLNDKVSSNKLIKMLAQHVVTLPIFNTLFAGVDFASHNPIANAMDAMLDALEKTGSGDLRGRQEKKLSTFYKSVEEQFAWIGQDDTKTRLETLNSFYETFFKAADRDAYDKNGVAYTPVALVDFVLRSVDNLLRSEFGIELTEKDVHIIEPFVGTGTFLHRLLTIKPDPTDSKNNYIIQDKDIDYKFANEIHANEIMLLAYYIAKIKIEEGYFIRKQRKLHAPYEGLALTDTFSITSDFKEQDEQEKLIPSLADNNQRITRRSSKKVRAIIGNPPWGLGNISKNDYPDLSKRIDKEYKGFAKKHKLKGRYTNSYLYALRWASDRINDEEGGIIGFVLPNSLLDNLQQRPIRGAIAKEFTSVWVYNLLGHSIDRTGDAALKEGDTVFNVGIQQGVCIALFVKNPNKKGFKLHYRVVKDYATQAEKLREIETVQAANSKQENWTSVTPDDNFDWINQIDKSFYDLKLLTSDEGTPNMLTEINSNGIMTGRDNWVLGYEKNFLSNRITAGLKDLNDIQKDLLEVPETEREEELEKRVSKENLEKGASAYSGVFEFTRWNGKLADAANAGIFKTIKGKTSHDHVSETYHFDEKYIYVTHHRPFVKTHLYLDPDLIHNTYKIPEIFPISYTASSTSVVRENVAICIPGKKRPFSVIATDTIPNLDIMKTGKVIPRYKYSSTPSQTTKTEALPNVSNLNDNNRDDNISEYAIELFDECYPNENIDKDDIWFYIYGALHAQDWREKFAEEIKKETRIPMAKTIDAFWIFRNKGEELMSLHLGYEIIQPYPLQVRIGNETIVPIVKDNGVVTYDLPKDHNFYRIDEKMRWGDKGSILEINKDCHILDIPPEANDKYIGSNTKHSKPYIINNRTPLEWAIRELTETTDEKGDANQWHVWQADEDAHKLLLHLLRLVRVSVESMQLISELPKII